MSTQSTSDLDEGYRVNVYRFFPMTSIWGTFIRGQLFRSALPDVWQRTSSHLAHVRSAGVFRTVTFQWDLGYF